VLRIRLLVAHRLFGPALELIDACVGTAHVAVHRSAARRPAGDVIEAVVAREAVDGLIDRLVQLGLTEDGSIEVSAPELTLSRSAERAAARAPGRAADALVWEELAAKTEADSELTGTFLVLLTVATMLAAIGVLTDSTITVVGAMVVGPEFGALAALAVGLVDRRWAILRRAALALVVGFPFAMAVTALGVLLAEMIGLVHRHALTTPGPATEFIYHPGPWSAVVALLAGVAGMVSLTSDRSAALVGVFISVTTVPAAGYVATALVLGYPARAVESALQLVINLAGIVVAAAVVLLIRRRRTEAAPQAR
jgi:uncharacterized hydrophobic protein (TIGR00271 family)